MLEVGYFKHQSPHCLRALQNIQHKHACWTSQTVLTGEKADSIDFTHWEQGIKLRSPTWTAFIKTQSKWEVGTILIYHSKFIGKHMHWSSVIPFYLCSSDGSWSLVPMVDAITDKHSLQDVCVNVSEIKQLAW